MERLSCSDATQYVPIEAAIHVSRYAGAVALSPGKRVLDIACGEGYGAYLMAQAGAAEVTGVDVSAAAIAASAAQFPHPNLRFLASDASALDGLLGDAQFDLIVSLETIEHLGDPLGFLQSLRRRCASSGTIILSCPNDHWYYRPGEQNPYHVRKYTFAEFRALAEEVLGAADAWYLGTAAFGFAAVPLDGALPGQTGADYADARRTPAGFLCRPGTEDGVTLDRGSYFLGAWGPGAAAAQGAAVFPVSMDRYADMVRTGDLAAALATETAARARLQAALQVADAALRDQQQAAERGLAEANTAAAAALQRAQQDQHVAECRLAEESARSEQALRLGRVQVHALRKENAILFESIARLQAAAGAAEAERTRGEQLATELAELRVVLERQAEALAAAAASAAQPDPETERLRAAQASLLEERDFLLAERERIFARMRPVWRLAQMIPPPIRRGMRRVGGPMLRRLASQA
ncbi:class I SAM-dependent methyltransferase [Dankookia sp. GCM10030260]|uniref:class I SAM-dependent methyltransferase n=1 Tax=Dankookia sp. GCM10030260 TaxID=3273390 RepID=UPI003612AA0F